MNRPVIAIVQARMGASRLPNKMMLWLHGHPVVEWVRQRIHSAAELDKVVFALPDTIADDVLADYLKAKGEIVFRGDEKDVLGRFHGAAVRHGAGAIVRVCADNPLIAGTEVDRLIKFFAKGGYDYVYNHIPRNNRYPDGLGAEIAPMVVLDRLHHEAILPEHREHVFNYLWSHADRFRITTCDPLDEALAHPELKLDLDTIEDYARLLRLQVTPETSPAGIVAAALAAKQCGVNP